MFEDNPAAKQRAMGLAALAAIGLGGAVAVDLLVTGGFDFGPGRAAYDREQASAYVRMVDAAQYVGDSVRSIGDSWFLRPPDTSASEERLAGGDDGSMPPDTALHSSEGGIYDEIAALYAESEALIEEPAYEEPAYQDALPLDAHDALPSYVEPTHEDESASAAEKEPSASESESPW